MGRANTIQNVSTPADPPQNIVLGSAVRSDSANLPDVAYAISFSSAGAIKVITVGGQTVTIPSGSLAAGIQHSMQITKLFDTGTNAADIVLYY